MRLVLIGPPGAGKGTQSARIAEWFDIPAIATGDIFRDHVSKQTSLGKLAQVHLDAGDLVPDNVTCDMVADRLAHPDAQRGFLLDGFPRTVPQAGKLDEMISDSGEELDVALQLAIDETHVLSRLRARQHQTHRVDDQIETVRHRLAVYAEQTAPLLTYYGSRQRLIAIDAVGAIESVAERAFEALARHAPVVRA